MEARWGVAAAVVAGMAVSIFCAPAFSELGAQVHLRTPHSKGTVCAAMPNGTATSGLNAGSHFAGPSTLLFRVYAMLLLQLGTTAIVAYLVAALALPEEYGCTVNRSMQRHVPTTLSSKSFLSCLACLTCAVLVAPCALPYDPWQALHLFEAYAILMGIWAGLVSTVVPEAVAKASVATANILALPVGLSLGSWLVVQVLSADCTSVWKLNLW